MSFWKNLFGGGGGSAAEPEPAPQEEYKGFVIKATLMPIGSEYQLAGTIERDMGAGEIRVHKFVRADRLSSRDDAVAFALAKGRQIVDEQGKTLFS